MNTNDNSCDSCEALMINGVYCHEMGCPVHEKQKQDALEAELEEEWRRRCDVPD